MFQEVKTVNFKRITTAAAALLIFGGALQACGGSETSDIPAETAVEITETEQTVVE